MGVERRGELGEREAVEAEVVGEVMLELDLRCGALADGGDGVAHHLGRAPRRLSDRFFGALESLDEATDVVALHLSRRGSGELRVGDVHDGGSHMPREPIDRL